MAKKAKDAFKEIDPLTEKHLSDAIWSMKAARTKTFDSHKVIEAIMRNSAKKYVRALYGHKDDVHPIKSFHALIGKAIKQIKGVESKGRKTSRNVKGGKTGNEVWKLTDEFVYKQ